MTFTSGGLPALPGSKMPSFAPESFPPRPLRVSRVITWLPVGGIERKILAVLPRLNPDLFQVRLLCIRERGELADTLEASGIPVDVIPFKSRLHPPSLLAMKRYLQHHQFDLIHSHMYRSNVPATVAGKWAGTPVIIGQVHNVDTWETLRQRTMDRLLCRWRQGMIGVSERVREDMTRNLGLPREKTEVIYNGVDLKPFADRSQREGVRREWGLEPEDVAVVYHGRLVSQKNPELLVKLAEELGGPYPRLRVMILGDGGLREKLEGMVREKKLGERVRFLGKRDDIPRQLQGGDIGVLPSFKEGFSNALVEAMAAGLAMVATDVGGNGEALISGESGWIVPPQEDDLFLKKVESFLKSPGKTREMGLAAQERAGLFSLDRMVEQVERYYLKLARQHAHRLYPA